MKDLKKIIKMPYVIDILSLSDGKSNIQNISDQIGISYKTTFLKIKELEKMGLIKIDGRNVSLVNEKSLSDNIDKFNMSKKYLEDQNKKLIAKNLNILKNNRFMPSMDFFEIIYNDNQTFLPPHLEEAGLIRTRTEITKKGIAFIKHNEK